MCYSGLEREGALLSRPQGWVPGLREAQSIPAKGPYALEGIQLLLLRGGQGEDRAWWQGMVGTACCGYSFGEIILGVWQVFIQFLQAI